MTQEVMHRRLLPSAKYIGAIAAVYVLVAILVTIISIFAVFVFAHPFAGVSAIISFLAGIVAARLKLGTSLGAKFANAVHTAHHSA